MALTNRDRQNGVAVRTAAQLEQKLELDKRFSEVYGIADGARTAADEAKETAEEAANLTQDKVFNALTNNGENEGLFRDQNGNLYINATYIKSGVYTSTQKAFVPPTYSVYARIEGQLTSMVQTIPDEEIPLYDFNGNGHIDSEDLELCKRAMNGTLSVLDGWGGKVETDVTVTIDPASPTAFITVSGTDMWGGQFHRSIGRDSAYLEKTEMGSLKWWDYGKIDGEVWLNPPLEHETEYVTAEMVYGDPIMRKVDGFGRRMWKMYSNDNTWKYDEILLEREEVSSGDTHYIYERFNSGKAVLWMEQINYAEWGGSSSQAYYSTDSFDHSFPPTLFVSAPHIQASCVAEGGYVTATVNGVSAKNARIGFVRFDGGDNGLYVTAQIYAVGKWC